jgi:hypothetical protein
MAAYPGVNALIRADKATDLARFTSKPKPKNNKTANKISKVRA